MPGLGAIRDDVIEALKSDQRFAGIQIRAEYAGTQRALPVTKAAMTVGIERVELQSSALGNSADGAGDFPACLPAAEVTMRFDFCFPREAELSRYFAGDLFDCLLMKAGAVKLWTEAVKPESAAMISCLRVFAVFRTLLVPGETAEEKQLIGSVTLKRTD